jgi:hypothetical protein
VVPSELRRGEPIEAPARVLAKRLNDLDVAANGGSESKTYPSPISFEVCIDPARAVLHVPPDVGL